MFKHRRVRKAARKAFENQRYSKRIVSCAGFRPWEVWGSKDDGAAFLVQITRREDSCPIVAYGSGYDAVRQGFKNIVRECGYRGYAVLVRKLD